MIYLPLSRNSLIDVRRKKRRDMGISRVEKRSSIKRNTKEFDSTLNMSDDLPKALEFFYN